MTRFACLFALVVLVATWATGCPLPKNKNAPPPSVNLTNVPIHHWSKEGSPILYIQPVPSSASPALFAIRLHSNPTTGYTWLPAAKTLDGGIKPRASLSIQYMDCIYEPTRPVLLGSGGHDTFLYTIEPSATAGSLANLELVYQRPWIPQDEATDFQLAQIEVVLVAV